MAFNFPSIPLAPNPPGTTMPSYSFNVEIFSGSFSKSSLFIQSILALTPALNRRVYGLDAYVCIAQNKITSAEVFADYAYFSFFLADFMFLTKVPHSFKSELFNLSLNFFRIILLKLSRSKLIGTS